jgi:hypothetical protein
MLRRDSTEKEMSLDKLTFHTRQNSMQALTRLAG